MHLSIFKIIAEIVHFDLPGPNNIFWQPKLHFSKLKIQEKESPLKSNVNKEAQAHGFVIFTKEFSYPLSHFLLAGSTL